MLCPCSAVTSVYPRTNSLKLLWIWNYSLSADSLFWSLIKIAEVPSSPLAKYISSQFAVRSSRGCNFNQSLEWVWTLFFMLSKSPCRSNWPWWSCKAEWSKSERGHIWTALYSLPLEIWLEAETKIHWSATHDKIEIWCCIWGCPCAFQQIFNNHVKLVLKLWLFVWTLCDPYSSALTCRFSYNLGLFLSDFCLVVVLGGGRGSR